jgi:hypothetical protein
MTTAGRLGMRVDRRQSMALMALAVVAGHRSVRAEAIVEDADDLKPGQFTWHPDRSPVGPVSIIVSIPDQRVSVYRNGIRIAVSTCSTGKPGHSTPTGVFTILQKDKNHRSSTYNDAPMPNMNRLTWSGIALHAGQLPGYPASHGCVRLPLAFSAKLFEVTHVGTPVIIAGSATDPKEIVHPGLVLSRYAENEFDTVQARLKGKSLPAPDHQDNPTPPASVLVSAADRQIIVLENGEIVAQGEATISDPGTPLGSHVFILNGAHDGVQGMSWHAIGHDPAGAAQQPAAEVLTRIAAPPAVMDAVSARLHPGLVFVTTDLPSQPDTRSGRDFVVLSQEDA